MNYFCLFYVKILNNFTFFYRSLLVYKRDRDFAQVRGRGTVRLIRDAVAAAAAVAEDAPLEAGWTRRRS